MKIQNNLFISSLALGVYLFVAYLFEYIFTEKYFVFKEISSYRKTFFLVFVLLISSVFPPKLNFKSNSKIIFLSVLLLILSLIGNEFYTRYYDNRQKIPKIYSISKNWGVQGNVIEIDGNNFGASWEQGKVMVDDMEFEIKKWSDEKIETIQPVPDHFWKGNLYVINHHQNSSNTLEYEVFDPNKLNEKN
jgi:hypothetical protein